MAISRAQLLKELLPGLNALFGLEYAKYGEEAAEIFTDSIIDDRFKDNVVVGGLMLCKAPEELVKERNDYYKQQTAAQMRSVDNNLMRESDPRMPIFNDRKSTVTFGKG